ncbi:hypothetical protein Pyrfu_0263 [Pyrolobus fumarii 1A]|uniref:Uncharacterized protein n=1 Tax=Pyrolobus fumarii (strain DSM 11204 / 1A) TaxID=694429 RepID=G0EF92_PYRF1|nr:hypothetical protein [Pyrolobus fumarii]AEM38135.1 hypothetical protein Pyrfu_0263 [Pyrolobus fumarii 1A]
MAEDVVRILRAVKEFEEKLTRIESSIEKDASSLLAAAEERARRLETKAEEIVDRARSTINALAEDEIARIRDELEKKKREVLASVEATARANFEKAVEAALEVLANAVRISRR